MRKLPLYEANREEKRTLLGGMGWNYCSRSEKGGAGTVVGHPPCTHPSSFLEDPDFLQVLTSSQEALHLEKSDSHL